MKMHIVSRKKLTQNAERQKPSKETFVKKEPKKSGTCISCGGSCNYYSTRCKQCHLDHVTGPVKKEIYAKAMEVLKKEGILV